MKVTSFQSLCLLVLGAFTAAVPCPVVALPDPDGAFGPGLFGSLDARDDFRTEAHADLEDSLGACCVCLDSCAVMTSEQRDAAGGLWFGPDIVCDPNPCVPIGTEGGACCFPDGSCALVSMGCECRLRGGQYLGDLTECHPNPCLSPVEPTSWGRSKARYR
jgi:hypothetical protein